MEYWVERVTIKYVVPAGNVAPWYSISLVLLRGRAIGKTVQ